MLRQLLTGKDNKTWDLGRILWGIAYLVYSGLSILHTVKTGSFDPVSFGVGTGTILAGGGVALGAKKGTEPDK